MQPLLSIVVLVYNTAEYLHECFDSLLTQEYGNIEIIAIDDCSTDNSYDICLAYQQRHENFRCLTKPNEGGAVSGNLGISMARGEYVALVDSDDVVFAKGYALMMREALEHGADIVVGKAARLKETVLPGPFLFEPFAWVSHRVVHAVRDFPDLLHDGFYWNKVFRTDFLREYGLGMVPGLLYADRPFVHKAYFYSRKTVVIPELVYLWRVRNEASARSITQNKSQAANYRDRMNSVRIEWQDFEGVPEADWYRREIAVTNLQRTLHVMPDIVASPSFRAFYVEQTQALLTFFGDLDYRALGGRRCLLLELLKRGEIAGLCYLLGRPMIDRLVGVEDRVYWQQPFLNNPELDIDPEVARIAFPTIGFFRIAELTLEGSRLELRLHVHDLIWDNCTVEFELNSIYGEGTIVFQSLGRQDAHLFAYAVDLMDDLPADIRPGDAFGLAMRYQWQDIRGMYRIGTPLLRESLVSTLPLISGPIQVVCGPETGGCGVILSPERSPEHVLQGDAAANSGACSRVGV